jgi:glucokinase
MTDHSRHAIVGAFGATYISLAIADIDELTISDFALLNSADFEKPMDALERYLQSVPHWPNKVGIAVTGEVSGDKATMSHRAWTITKNDIRATTRADQVHMVRDMEALAIMLPHLSAYDTTTIAAGAPTLSATKLVVNAGATLGVAALVQENGHWVPVIGKAGETSFYTGQPGFFDPVSSNHHRATDVLSGRGLLATYRKVAELKGLPAELQGARQITAKGLSREDPAAREALDLMATWLARYVADMALTFGAGGGIYLAGGLAANIIPQLTPGPFAETLKQELGSSLPDVSVQVIKTGADAGMRGAALALANSLVTPTLLRRAR